MPIRWMMMPWIWQWSGNGTLFADVVPLGFHLARVICVGVIGKSVMFARLAHAVAGSGRFCWPTPAPRHIREAPITRLPRIVIRCRRKYRSPTIWIFIFDSPFRISFSCHSFSNVAFHGCHDNVFRILLKQQSLPNQSVCRQRYAGHVLTVVSVTLFNGKSRVALGEPLSPGCCKRNILTRQGAILSFRKWRTPESPPCVCRQRDLDINSTYSRNVIAVDVRPGH